MRTNSYDNAAFRVARTEPEPGTVEYWAEAARSFGTQAAGAIDFITSGNRWGLSFDMTREAAARAVSCAQTAGTFARLALVAAGAQVADLEAPASATVSNADPGEGLTAAVWELDSDGHATLRAGVVLL